jgi:CheY-like chemotaxis protein
MLTAKRTREDVKKAISLHCNDYIAKPFTVKMLKQKVSRIRKIYTKKISVPTLDILEFSEIVTFIFYGIVNIDFINSLQEILNLLKKVRIKNFVIDFKFVQNINEETKSSLEEIKNFYKIKFKNFKFKSLEKVEKKKKEEKKENKIKPYLIRKKKIDVIPLGDVNLVVCETQGELLKGDLHLLSLTLDKLLKAKVQKIIIDFSKIKKFEESDFIVFLDKLKEQKVKFAFVLKERKLVTFFRETKIHLWSSIFNTVEEALRWI